MNVGTPAAPTRRAVRRYLAQFLSDRRVVDINRILWLPLLHGVILNTRPARSARLYRNIWTEAGSPLLVTLEKQASALERHLRDRVAGSILVEAGMGYGRPSIADGLKRLRDRGAERILLLPLFPQYSATTTASTLDAAMTELMKWVRIPSVQWIDSYCCHEAYLEALSRSIGEHWDEHGRPEKLLFSFHGIPERYSRKGDPYRSQCENTAAEVVQRLDLDSNQWEMAFQSRSGPEEWLKPYTDEVLEQWAREGVASVHVIAPGFSADCLETLDEIDREYRELYEEHGGTSFSYIPALNDRPAHIEALARVVADGLAGRAFDQRQLATDRHGNAEDRYARAPDQAGSAADQHPRAEGGVAAQ